MAGFATVTACALVLLAVAGLAARRLLALVDEIGRVDRAAAALERAHACVGELTTSTSSVRESRAALGPPANSPR